MRKLKILLYPCERIDFDDLGKTTVLEENFITIPRDDQTSSIGVIVK